MSAHINVMKAEINYYFSNACCLIDAQLKFIKGMNIVRSRQVKEIEILKR